MQTNARRVAAGLICALYDKVAQVAEELCASGPCAAAVTPLTRAIDFVHLPSRSLNMWIPIQSRKNVANDRKSAFELAEGARLGCHHCTGVMALCYSWGGGCEADGVLLLTLARES